MVKGSSLSTMAQDTMRSNSQSRERIERLGERLFPEQDHKKQQFTGANFWGIHPNQSGG